MDKFNHQQQKHLIMHPSDLSTHQHVPPRPEGGGGVGWLCGLEKKKREATVPVFVIPTAWKRK